MMRAINKPDRRCLRRMVAMVVGVGNLVGCGSVDDSSPATTVDMSTRCLSLAQEVGVDDNLVFATRNDVPPELLCTFVNETGALISLVESADGLVRMEHPEQENYSRG